MDDSHRQQAIAELTERVALLERRTANEVAALRAEIDALRGPARRPQPARPRQTAHTPSPDLSWLVGPRGFALAGGLVTILGLGFLFALAASRGWIGPAARCAFGAGLSLLLLATAVAVKRRFDNDVAARAAAGTGIGGLYLTLFAATRLYHLLPQELAWPAVVGVAALAVGFALAWSSEVLAALGLVTAALAPPLVAGHLSAREAGAAVIAAGAALGIGQARAWRFVGLVTYAVALVETVAVVADDPGRAAWVLSGVLFALALAGAATYQRRDASLSWVAGLLAGSTMPLALVAVHELVAAPVGEAVFRGAAQAAALAGLAVVYALGAWLCLRRSATRELGELVAALGLVAAGLAAATALSNGALVVAWSLAGLSLAALAARSGRRRYYVPSFAYLWLAVLHVLAFDEPPRLLFHDHQDPAGHLGSLLVVTAALALVAVLMRDGREPFQHARRLVAGLAGALSLYGASLLVLELAASFQRGQTLVSLLWALVGLALIGLGLARRYEPVRTGGVALLGIALAKLFLFDLSQLSSLARVASFLSVGLVLFAAAFVVQRLASGRPA